MLLNIDLIRQIQQEQDKEPLHYSLGRSLIRGITPEERERMEEEREDMLRWLPFNEAENEY